MHDQSISEEFAKNILRACYALDARLGEIEFLCSISRNEEELSRVGNLLPTRHRSHLTTPR